MDRAWGGTHEDSREDSLVRQWVERSKEEPRFCFVFVIVYQNIFKLKNRWGGNPALIILISSLPSRRMPIVLGTFTYSRVIIIGL